MPVCPSSSDSPSPATGFPSPADDYSEARLDLNVELIPRPLATLGLRVGGGATAGAITGAMAGDGLADGDLLVIDRSVAARPGLVVVAVHEGSFLLRRLQRRGVALWLVASDRLSPPIPLAFSPEDAGAELWGVVLHAVHPLLPPRARQR